MDVALPDGGGDAEKTALTGLSAGGLTEMFVGQGTRATEGLDDVLDGNEGRDVDDAPGAHGHPVAATPRDATRQTEARSSSRRLMRLRAS